MDATRQRVLAAFGAMGLALPPKRITINLLPLDLIKKGSHYDVPIALALLSAMGIVDAAQLSGWVAIGELSADGRIVMDPRSDMAAMHAREAGKGLICAAGQTAAFSGNGLPALAAVNLTGVVRQLKRMQHSRVSDADVVPALGERSVPPTTAPGLFAKAFAALRSRSASPARVDEIADLEPCGDAEPTSVVREVQHADYRPDNPDAWRDALLDVSAPERVTGYHRREPSPDFHGIGHRARLRQRLIEGGVDALADYEVLEFLLFGARQRGDTKPLAKALMKRFGSLPAVLNADPKALMRVPGIGTASVGVIMIATVAAKRMARVQVSEKALLSDWQALTDYLAINMAHLTREQVRVLYLDRHNRLVKDEQLSDGTIDEASIHPREVIHRALNLGAGALIMVHNHPSGSPEPSKADIQITNRIAEAARLVDIVVLDHIIVGREGYVSLRQKGLV